ncbi:MAG: TatD family hydrolase [Chloroflexi bacterium]|nr:TatD family hydrolase [Chloroflexota bacterium]
MIDTHCHLTFPDFAGGAGVPGVLTEAAAAGVSGCITISTTTRDCLETLRLATTHERVWCTSGIHPLHSHEGPHEWGNLRVVAGHERCVAWGELGLDNHYSELARSVQDAVLARHLSLIEACRKGEAWEGTSGPKIDKPIVVHCREAFGDLIPTLKRTTLDPARFVFHCFTAGPDEARMVLDFGAFVSFTGVATYRNAAAVREAARLVPADRIMVETDAPFLSPEPVRGQRPCRPAMVRHTAEAVAAARGEPFERFHEQINANTRRFFGIDAT